MDILNGNGLPNILLQFVPPLMDNFKNILKAFVLKVVNFTTKVVLSVNI